MSPTLNLLRQGQRHLFRPRRRPGELTPFVAPRIQGTLFGAFPKSEQAQAQRPKQPPPLPPGYQNITKQHYEISQVIYIHTIVLKYTAFQ